MPFTMAQKDNKPFQIRPPRTLVNRLEALAQRHRRDSANQLAVEILRDTIDIWAAAAQAMDDVLAQHQERARAVKEEMLRRPIHPAEAEPNNQPEIRGRKGRK